MIMYLFVYSYHLDHLHGYRVNDCRASPKTLIPPLATALEVKTKGKNGKVNHI